MGDTRAAATTPLQIALRPIIFANRVVGVVVEVPAERWLERQERKHGIPRNVAASLTMRSRSYAARRIEAEERSLGVLVVESVRTAAAGPQRRKPTAF